MKIHLLNALAPFMFIAFAAPAQTGNVTGVAINTEGTLMYYTVEKQGEHALYKAVKNASGKWDEGVSEDSFNEYIKGYVVKTPFLTCDEQTLYFSANPPGAKGFDIFYSRKNGDSWSKPASLSPVINTDRDEISPSLPAGNLTVFFARSDENGCYSIYSSETDVSGWTPPQMLPAPVNVGCENSVYISPAGETLLFSSDRLSEKKKKRYSVFHSALVSKNIWTAPVPVDKTPVKDYDEYTPAIDFRDSRIVFAKCVIDSSTCSIHSCEAPVYKPYTVVKGIVKDENGKPVRAEITVRDAYTSVLSGISNSNPANGQYILVLPNNNLFNVNYAVKNGARLFENINTVDSKPGQTIVKDIVLIDNVAVDVTVYDALSDKLIDAGVHAYEKTKTASVSRIGEGKYRVLAPAFGSLDIELYKENYVKENILVTFGDYATFPEMHCLARLKPDMRSGVVNVKDIVTNSNVNANIEVRNLDIDDEKVIVSVRDTGKYEFNIRKDCQYSISVTLKDHFYYYAVWKADASRIGQTLNVHLVPLNEINKIPMQNLLFNDNESTLSPEASGELACVAKALKNNPEYRAVISLYYLTGSENELVAAQYRARSVITFLETGMIPKTGYRVEVFPVDEVKIPDISFISNTATAKK
jgi:hypothetical protein